MEIRVLVLKKRTKAKGQTRQQLHGSAAPALRMWKVSPKEGKGLDATAGAESVGSVARSEFKSQLCHLSL